MQEMNEMKNLVIQALEARGSLSQLRAQVRASVFAAIEDQASQSLGKKNAFHWENSLCQELHKSQTGLAAIELIHEFMEYFRMDYTLNVFSSESNYKKGACTRESLIKQLRVESQEKKPLLLLMLEQMTNQTGNSQSAAQLDASPSVQLPQQPTGAAALLSRAAEHLQRLPETRPAPPSTITNQKNPTPPKASAGLSAQLEAQLPNDRVREQDQPRAAPTLTTSTPSLTKEAENKTPRSPSGTGAGNTASQAKELEAAAQAAGSRSKLEHPHRAQPAEEEEEFPEAIEEQPDEPHQPEENDQGVVLGASDDMYISESYGYNCSVTSEAMQQFDHVEEVEPADDGEEEGEPEQDDLQ